MNYGGAFWSRHGTFVSHLTSLVVPLSLAGCLKREQAAERFDHLWLRPGKGLGWRDTEQEINDCSKVDGNTKAGQAPLYSLISIKPATCVCLLFSFTGGTRSDIFEGTVTCVSDIDERTVLVGGSGDSGGGGGREGGGSEVG